MAITGMQIFLIISLVLVTVFGYLNQRKRKNQNTTQDYENFTSEEETKAKNYIESYKSEYPRDSLKQGLISNFSLSDSTAEEYLNKYM